MSNRYAPNEALCPIPFELLALLLRSDRHRTAEIALELPPLQRATLAAFAYGRSHMRALGLAVATQCDEKSLWEVAGAAGEALFEHSRSGEALEQETSARQRKPITLARVAA
jgi:hypothetical protein